MRSMTDHSRGSGIHAGVSKGFEEFRRHHRVASSHFVSMNRNHHDIRLAPRFADLSHRPFQVDDKRFRLIPLLGIHFSHPGEFLRHLEVPGVHMMNGAETKWIEPRAPGHIHALASRDCRRIE